MTSVQCKQCKHCNEVIEVGYKNIGYPAHVRVCKRQNELKIKWQAEYTSNISSENNHSSYNNDYDDDADNTTDHIPSGPNVCQSLPEGSIQVRKRLPGQSYADFTEDSDWIDLDPKESDDNMESLTIINFQRKYMEFLKNKSLIIQRVSKGEKQKPTFDTVLKIYSLMRCNHLSVPKAQKMLDTFRNIVKASGASDQVILPKSIKTVKSQMQAGVFDGAPRLGSLKKSKNNESLFTKREFKWDLSKVNPIVFAQIDSSGANNKSDSMKLK